MQPIVATVPVMADNYAYVVACPETKQAAAVDPTDAQKVQQRVEDMGLRLVAIWATHHHYDHTGGNEELIRLNDSTLRVFGGGGRIPGLTDTITDGETIQLGHLDVRVIATPGHTQDAVVYLVDGAAAFTGDTLFGAGCGRLFEGDAETMNRSLNERLSGELSPETRLYFGHEYTQKNMQFAVSVDPDNLRLRDRINRVNALVAAGKPSTPSTWEEELQTNPFLRCSSAEIRRVLDLAHGSDLDVFARLRQMRNSF